MRKRLLIAFIYCSCSLSAYGQDLQFDIGMVNSTFDYTDSKGEGLDGLLRVNNPFLSVGYRSSIKKTEKTIAYWRGHANKTPYKRESSIFLQKLHLTGEVAYSTYGAVARDEVLGNELRWKINFVSMAFGVDYEFLNVKTVTFYVKSNVSYEILTKGHQTINNRTYSLRGEEEFNRPFAFVRGGLGAYIRLGNNASLRGQYMFGKSFNSRGANGESLKVAAQNLSLGLLVDIRPL